MKLEMLKIKKKKKMEEAYLLYLFCAENLPLVSFACFPGCGDICRRLKSFDVGLTLSFYPKFFLIWFYKA